MTGAVTVSALLGMLSLIAGAALGWHLRRSGDRCPACGEHQVPADPRQPV